MKLNPFTCLQLYDLCLKRGFNSMDSYLMLKEDSGLLIHAYEIMESSRKYSEQQLEYISTILTVKTMYDNMISSGSLVAPYTDNDEKKSIIYFENIPIGKRIRDIIEAPNGEIVLLTDQQGGVDGFNDVPEIIFLVKKEKWGKTKDEVGIKK